MDNVKDDKYYVNLILEDIDKIIKYTFFKRNVNKNIKNGTD